MDDIRCLTTMLSGTPMRICGRISKSGMKRSKAESQGAHFLLYEHSEIQNVDSCLEHTLQTMGPGDLFVTGANALDAFGHAALLIGSPGGGGYEPVCRSFIFCHCGTGAAAEEDRRRRHRSKLHRDVQHPNRASSGT